MNQKKPFRPRQVNELIRRLVSELIQREVELPPGVFVTVSRVETDPDFKRARVFVTVLPEGVSLSTFRTLERQIGIIQHLLNQQLRMKPVPKIAFKLDVAEEKRHRVEELLDQLHS